MAGVQFNEDESGYIAGVLAASLSESGVIGVVAGREDVPPVVKFVNGYTVGAESVNPDIRVLSIYNESFTDVAKGASDAAQFIGEGADVIFGAGGQTGSGGVAAAAEEGVWAIGVDQDEYFTTFAGGTAPGSEFLASSAIKRVDLVDVPADRRRRSRTSSRAASLVGHGRQRPHHYAQPHDADVPAEVTAAVEAARAGLADGSDHDRHLRHRRPVRRRGLGLRLTVPTTSRARSSGPVPRGGPGPVAPTGRTVRHGGASSTSPSGARATGRGHVTRR